MSQKSQTEVGHDFDGYVNQWSKKHYKLEVKSESGGLVGYEENPQVRLPGDEWGLQTDLLKTYEPILQRYCPGNFSVLEVGAGSGRLTELLCSTFSARIRHYHTLDVSEAMTSVLKERLSGAGVNVTHHLGGSDKLAVVPDGLFDMVISQSCWSHVNLYDQYLYLRDLRGKLVRGGVLFVNGVFMLGGQVDWTWDRFVRRIDQQERQLKGVYHEVTGTSAIVEMAIRLGWEIEVLASQAFILRFAGDNPKVMYRKWEEVPEANRMVRHAPSLAHFIAGNSRVAKV